MENREAEIERLSGMLRGGRPPEALAAEGARESNERLAAHLNIQVQCTCMYVATVYMYVCGYSVHVCMWLQCTCMYTGTVYMYVCGYSVHVCGYGVCVMCSEG